MNKPKNKSIMVLILVMVILALNTAGCSLLDRISSPQDGPGNEQNEKIPKELEEMESGIENIFRTLGAPAAQGESKEGQNIEGQNNQGQNENSQAKESQGQEKEGQENQGQENQGTQQKQKQNESEPWKKVSQEVEGLHSRWNNYMPQAVEKNADSKVIDGFSKSLNDLTNIIEEQDKTKTLLAANFVYSSIPDFYSLYKNQHAGEVKRMFYNARSCVLYSTTNKWTDVDSSMQDLKSTWTLLKAALDKEKLQSINKLDLSIYELEKVAEKRYPQLINIKGRLTLTNIEELQKELKEMKE